MAALPSTTAFKLDAVHTLLRARRLDRTLASEGLSLPWPAAPFAAAALTETLRGGIPRGQLSEIHGPVSSGRTSLAWGALAAATARGEWGALIDTFDRFDPERAAEAGLTLSRLLWVRGQALSKTSGAIDPAWIPGERSVQGPGTLLERTIDRAIKAIVERELAEVALLLMAGAPVARSAGGLSIASGVANTPGVGSREYAGSRDSAVGNRKTLAESELTRWHSRLPTPDSRRARDVQVQWKGVHDRTRRLGGLSTRLRATSPRGYVGELPLAIG